MDHIEFYKPFNGIYFDIVFSYEACASQINDTYCYWILCYIICCVSQFRGPQLQVSEGGGPRVVVSTAAFHARVRGTVPGLGGLKETKMFFPHPRVKLSIVGSPRDREVGCSASDFQGLNFDLCVWRTVSSDSSHHPQEVLLAQFSLYVHKARFISFFYKWVRIIPIWQNNALSIELIYDTVYLN